MRFYSNMLQLLYWANFFLHKLPKYEDFEVITFSNQSFYILGIYLMYLTYLSIPTSLLSVAAFNLICLT